MKDKIYRANNHLSTISMGFTLIELVIVVSIIALISGISLFALSSARESGRDARRRGDLEEIASGLEMYKSDLNVYPNSITAGNSLSGGGNTYIEAIPDDPDSASLDYYYAPTASDGSACTTDCVRFRLWTALEVEPTPTPASYCGSTPPSCGTSNCNYCITNP